MTGEKRMDSEGRIWCERYLEMSMLFVARCDSDGKPDSYPVPVSLRTWERMKRFPYTRTP